MTGDGSQETGVWDYHERLLKWVAYMGGLVLFAIMLFVTASVLFRYLLNQPILGDQELVEIGMSLVVMMAMPFAALQNAHIRVDVLDGALGPRGRFGGDILARCVSCYVLLLLIQKTYGKAVDARKYGDVTNMIELPIWVAYAAITAGMGLFALVLAGQLCNQLRLGVKEYE